MGKVDLSVGEQKVNGAGCSMGSVDLSVGE